MYKYTMLKILLHLSKILNTSSTPVHPCSPLMIIQTDSSSSISSPVVVQIRRSYRVPKWRRQFLPPEDVLRHQPVHVVLPQQHHCSCVIGPRCTRHKGQLPEAHDPHGRVHRKPWKTEGRTEGKKRKGSGVSIDRGGSEAQRLISSQCSMFCSSSY